MIHHETKWNPMSAEDSMSVPTAAMQIAQAHCFHCGKVTRFAVPPEFVDWKIIAEQYRSRMEYMVGRFDRIVKDIDVMQSGSNPVRDYLNNEWQLILEEGRKRFMDDSDSMID